MDKQAYDERMVAFRLRCLELAADYCARTSGKETSGKDPVEIASNFEAFALNSTSCQASSASAVSDKAVPDTGHKP
jgi:hypothetical protein